MRRILLALTLLAFCASAAQAVPSLTLSADKKKLAAGENLTLTLNLAVPSSDPAHSGMAAAFTIPAPLTFVSATGPKLISNFATATYDGGLSVTSNTVTIRVTTQTVPITAVADVVTIPMGDLASNDSETATVVVKNP